MNENQWIPRSRFRRQQNKIRKQRISVVFNYSKITLTNAMEKVLNRGLKFCILPLKLDITQVLVDFNRFERTMIWHEFWHGRETETEYVPSIFKTRKNNLPKNYKVPNGLKRFLGAVKSEMMDPKNRNTATRNLPDDEIEALFDLIKLQKEGKIVIKPCDKGAGIIILTYTDYLKACMDHLDSHQINPDGTSSKFYNKVYKSQFEEVKNEIIKMDQEGHIISFGQSKNMRQIIYISDNPGKFNCT